MSDAVNPSPDPGYTHDAPFDSGHLPMSDIHSIYYEQYGPKDGKPVIFLHGGPGEGTSREHTLFFNPKIYRVILFDQRGAGKSTPHAELRENTAQLLVDDIETLRERFQIPKWHMVFGGSWGSCLGLLYAQTHPGRVGALVLRGICTFRKWELDWFYQTGGAPTLFPEFYENLRDFIPPSEQGDLLAAYHKRLNSPDPASRRAAARQWTIWELSTVSLLFDPVENLKDADDDDFNAAMARLETHYFINGAFMDEGQLLKSENTDRIRHIPTSIIQGRYDAICPPQVAYELHKALPDSKLYYIPDAGHSSREPGIRRKLIEVCDEYAEL